MIAGVTSNRIRPITEQLVETNLGQLQQNLRRGAGLYIAITGDDTLKWGEAVSATEISSSLWKAAQDAAQARLAEYASCNLPCTTKSKEKLHGVMVEIDVDDDNWQKCLVARMSIVWAFACFIDCLPGLRKTRRKAYDLLRTIFKAMSMAPHIPCMTVPYLYDEWIEPNFYGDEDEGDVKRMRQEKFLYESHMKCDPSLSFIGLVALAKKRLAAAHKDLAKEELEWVEKAMHFFEVVRPLQDIELPYAPPELQPEEAPNTEHAIALLWSRSSFMSDYWDDIINNDYGNFGPAVITLTINSSDDIAKIRMLAEGLLLMEDLVYSHFLNTTARKKGQLWTADKQTLSSPQSRSLRSPIRTRRTLKDAA